MPLPAPSTGKGEAPGRTPGLPPLQWIRFAVIALVAQVLVLYGLARLDGDGDLVAVFLPATHLLLLPFLIKNFSLGGIRLLTVGLVLNITVMVMNGGLMPVGPQAVEAVGRHDATGLDSGDYIVGTKNVYLTDSDTRAAFLSDSIILPVPRPFTRAISVGDILIAVAVAVVPLELAARAGVIKGFSARAAVTR